MFNTFQTKETFDQSCMGNSLVKTANWKRNLPLCVRKKHLVKI